MEEIEIVWTADQCRAALELLNVAVQAGGLRAAKAALPLADDLDRKLQAEIGPNPADPPTPAP